MSHRRRGRWHNHGTVTNRSRNWCTKALSCHTAGDRLPILSTRRLLARNNELIEQVREEHRLNREEHRLNREAAERHARSFDRATEAFNNDRAVMRTMVAKLDAPLEDDRRQSEAITGALVDLAAEIRSWREGNGSG